jgi:muconate cycloisomerase
MKIDQVDVIPIRIPNRVPMKLSTMLLEFQENVIVRLHAGDATGIGETEPLCGFQGCAESQATIVHMIRERFAPLLLGRDPFDVEKLVRDMENAIWGNPYAKAGVINALYDLMAKTLKMPLYQLLGGCYRDKIPVVWTIGIKDSKEMAKEALWALERGYRLLKIKIGAAALEVDVRNIAAIREAVGPGVGLRVDANGALSFSHALKLLKLLAPFDLELVEQPLPIGDLDGMARLIELSGIPIMPDESLHSPESALELVTKKAASIFGMKLAKHGGIYYGKKIAAIAQAAHLPIYPGNQPSTSVGSATAAHFFASTWNATLGGDFHVGPAGWLADDIVRNPLVVRDGHGFVPQGVGIGMELDENKLAKYMVKI